jgi:hypothetical protein
LAYVGCLLAKQDGHEFSDILANPALSIKQTDFQNVRLYRPRSEILDAGLSPRLNP